MKKIIILIFFIVIATNSHAGLFYDYRLYIEEYDQDTGLFYTSVIVKDKGFSIKTADTKAVDIYIFHPNEGVGRYLFEQKNNDEIVSLLYESYFDDIKKAVFYNVGDTSRYIKNNYNIQKRPLKDRLLITTYNTKSEDYSIWYATKNGKKLQNVVKLRKDDEWHIDVKNQKLRVFVRDGKNIKITTFEW